MNLLTVTDIERLAKAGVQMTLADIASIVMPDPPPSPPSDGEEWPKDLNQSFWQRWRRAHPHQWGRGEPVPFLVYAVEVNDTVHMFVAPNGDDPFVLTDVRGLFPSDALMAKLDLYERTRKK
jgi:hypothetical protein